MQNKSNKIILFSLLGIGILASVIAFIMAIKVSAAKSVIVDENKYSNEYFFQLMDGTNTDAVPENIQDAVQSARTANTMFNIASTILYILVAIAIIAALVAFFKLLRTKRQSFVKTLIVLLILCVIFFIAWIISSGTDLSLVRIGKIIELDPQVPEQAEKIKSFSKLVGAGAITVYIVFIVSLISLVVTEIIKFFKK